MSAKRLSLIAGALALVLWRSASHAQGQPRLRSPARCRLPRKA